MLGQYDNIGDIILRRTLLRWLRPLGTLHVYIGHAPLGYIEGLRLRKCDVIYKSYIRWYCSGLKSAYLGLANYAFKPGEIQLTIAGMKEHISILPLIMLIRMRNCAVIRIGSGSRQFSPLPRMLIWPSIAFSQLIAWRDKDTADYLKKGNDIPDLAFDEGNQCSDTPCNDARGKLVVSMRSDRKPMPNVVQKAIRRTAEDFGLDIVVVTQVARDSSMSRYLALELDAGLLDWNGECHKLQECRLREAYRQSKLVISDRLHVLIAAFTEGAIPINLICNNANDKIARHFRTAGLEDTSIRVQGRTSTQISEDIEAVLYRKEEIIPRLMNIRRELHKTKKQLIYLMQNGQLT